MTTKFRPVYVEWLDSASTTGWGSHTDASTDLCRSIAWLVHRDKEKIVLSTSLGDSGNKSMDRLAIPRAAVRKLKYLRNITSKR